MTAARARRSKEAGNVAFSNATTIINLHPYKSKTIEGIVLVSCHLRMWGLDTSFQKSKVHWSFENVVLQKIAENFTDETQDKWIEQLKVKKRKKTSGKDEVIKRWDIMVML